MVSKCILGHFQHGGKFVAQNSPTIHFDNHLNLVCRAISKWLRHLVCLFPNTVMPSFDLIPMVFSFFNDSSWILARSQEKLKTMLQPRSENSLSSKQERRLTMLMQNVGGGGVGANKVYWGRCENCEQTNFYILKFILAAKMILRPLKLYGVFLDPLNLSFVGDFSRS